MIELTWLGMPSEKVSFVPDSVWRLGAEFYSHGPAQNRQLDQTQTVLTVITQNPFTRRLDRHGEGPNHETTTGLLHALSRLRDKG